MLNNKGFTVIEVVISFTFVVIILASMFTIVINYQNETSKEQMKNSLLVYKNTLLEIVYDDIISGNMDSITSCGDKCVNINTKTDSYQLTSEVLENTTYITYRGNKYELPDSQNGLSQIENFVYRFDKTNKIYDVTIPIVHAELTDEENKDNNIQIIVSGKELSR